MSGAAERSARGWSALIGTPSLALLNLSANYTLVGPACAHQHAGVLHAVALTCFLLSGVLTLFAWREAKLAFVPLIGAVTGTLMTLVIAAQWIPVWMLSPCF